MPDAVIHEGAAPAPDIIPMSLPHRVTRDHELFELHDTQGSGDTWQTIPKTLGRGITLPMGIQGSSKETQALAKRHPRPLIQNLRPFPRPHPMPLD